VKNYKKSYETLRNFGFDESTKLVYTFPKANRAAPTGHLDCPAAVTLPGSVLAPLPQAAPRKRCACWLTLILYYKNAQNLNARTLGRKGISAGRPFYPQ